MPDIEFRLTATDEASPVIDKARKKMDQFNAQQTSASRKSSAAYGRMGGGTKESGGMSGIIGKGVIGNLAGLAIIAKAGLDIMKKAWAVLNQASPFLQSVMSQFKTAVNIYLRPLGDAIAKMFAPSSERAIEKAEKRSEAITQLEEDYGAIGALLGTFGFGLVDAYSAIAEFQYGVMNAMSKIAMWPLKKLGDLIGIKIPGSLSELQESIFGIEGGFQGLKEWFEGLPDVLSKRLNEAWENIKSGLSNAWSNLSNLGSDIWNGITGTLNNAWSVLSNFGSWLWTKITDAFSGAWSIISNFGSWIWEKITGALSGAWSIISNFGNWIWTKITDALSNIGASISGFGTWLWNKITGALSDITTKISGFGTWLWTKITDSLSTGWETLKTIGTTIYNSIKDAVSGIGREAYKALHNAIASLLNSIANIELPIVGKPFKGLIGTIPLLASGGIVTKPTIAMIGEKGAEAVVPLSRNMLVPNQLIVEINAPIYGVDDLERTFNELMNKQYMGYSSYR